jgi:two-component system, cell cycle response regulator CtrA
MRILIVEDEVNVARVLEMRLERAGLKSFSTSLGEEAIELAAIYDYDLIVLDLNLPDMYGGDVLRALRNKRIATPVLVLTGDASTQHKLRCFELGADDFLPKPFRCDELIARIRAIVRRTHGHADSVLQVGQLSINLDTRAALVGDRPLCLSGREYQILEVLALHKGATVTKEAFLNSLYGGLDEPEPKVIDVYICKIRKKLEDALGTGQYIQTVWGRGYTLQAPVPAVDCMAA